jgi:hypothetical protein
VTKITHISTDIFLGFSRDKPLHAERAHVAERHRWAGCLVIIARWTRAGSFDDLIGAGEQRRRIANGGAGLLLVGAEARQRLR